MSLLLIARHYPRGMLQIFCPTCFEKKLCNLKVGWIVSRNCYVGPCTDGNEQSSLQGRLMKETLKHRSWPGMLYITDSLSGWLSELSCYCCCITPCDVWQLCGGHFRRQYPTGYLILKAYSSKGSKIGEDTRFLIYPEFLDTPQQRKLYFMGICKTRIQRTYHI